MTSNENVTLIFARQGKNDHLINMKIGNESSSAGLTNYDVGWYGS